MLNFINVVNASSYNAVKQKRSLKDGKTCIFRGEEFYDFDDFDDLKNLLVSNYNVGANAGTNKNIYLNLGMTLVHRSGD